MPCWLLWPETVGWNTFPQIFIKGKFLGGLLVKIAGQERISLAMSDDDEAVMQAFREKVHRDILTEEEPDEVDEEEGEDS